MKPFDRRDVRKDVPNSVLTSLLACLNVYQGIWLSAICFWTINAVPVDIPTELDSIMAQCTAPINGHRSSAAAENCPACRGRRFGGYTSYSYPSYSPPSYPSYASRTSSFGGGGSSGARTKARWSSSGSSALYSPTEISALTPVRETIEKMVVAVDRRDFFLCHAWDDRGESAKDLHDRIETAGASVWFSEKDVQLGSSLLREIDKGLANSKVGIVLVTPALLRRLPMQSIADKELAALLLRNRLIPILHGVTFEQLSDVSPLLASRAGMNTKENTMEEIATKLAELVSIKPLVC